MNDTGKTQEAVLELSQITKEFPGVVALDRVDLDDPPQRAAGAGG